ncbi:hypothetical protein H103_02384 [Trichophyton rubrum CBS 288.86]|uniref:Uncharacterized protein n=1 Tax=Trichophyton rubrum CBS 288.86 TaxID=1215330 RepID=A0A022W9K5_TRIRU|nr:hypothetical protein H103_02384 [Trichophyton rubrum CBS 288.86]
MKREDERRETRQQKTGKMRSQRKRKERDGGGRSTRSRKANGGGGGGGAMGDCEDSTLGGHPAGHPSLVTATTGKNLEQRRLSLNAYTNLCTLCRFKDVAKGGSNDKETIQGKKMTCIFIGKSRS